MLSFPSIDTLRQKYLGLKDRFVDRDFGYERQAPLSFDLPLLVVVIALVGFGLVMVYSASIAFDSTWKKSNFSGPHHFVIRQLMCVAIGFCLLFAAMNFPTRFVYKSTLWLFLAVLVFCAVVTFSPLGLVRGGSKRWITVSGFAVQPTELLKLATIFFVARFIHLNRQWLIKGDDFKQSLLRGHLIILGIFALVAYVLVKQPDYGSTLVIFTTCMCLLFLANWDGRIVLFFAVAGVLLFIVAVLTTTYLQVRLETFVNPFAQEDGKGYQLVRSLYALARGSWTGVGLGASIEKILYLPEAHTDFIYAVIGEEFGFIGTASLITVYAWVVWRGLAIAKRALLQGQSFLAMVAQGITILLALQVIINIGVNVNMLPAKGLTLPLISYGGTSMIVCLLSLGVLLRIDREVRWMEQGYYHNLGVDDDTRA